MWCQHWHNKLTQTHISCQPISLSNSAALYLEVGLVVMAGVWEWGLPVSGSVVRSPLAEEREISPVYKHTEIAQYQGLKDAWIQCWVMFLQHVYLLIHTYFDTYVHLKDYLLWDYLHRKLEHLSLSNMESGGSSFSKSISTHDTYWEMPPSNFSAAMLFTYKLHICQSLGGYLFTRINIDICLLASSAQSVSRLLFVCPESIFLLHPHLLSKAAAIHGENTLYNSTLRLPVWTDEL